jgi:DNA-binding protein H-NS
MLIAPWPGSCLPVSWPNSSVVRSFWREMMAGKKRSTGSRPRKSAKRARKSSRRTKRTAASGRRTSLVGMTLDTLISLRDEAERLITTRASRQRKALEKQLARISRYVGAGPGRKVRKGGRPRKGRKVAPKYRNPANKSETWAGRGARPRWLRSLLNGGRRLEEFAASR